MTSDVPRPGWNGARVTAAIAFTIHRDHGTCWLCGHDGATSLDHVIPTILRPDLEWAPSNWRAAHLHPADHKHGPRCTDTCSCHVSDCTCPGNTGRRAQPPDQPPTRRW